MLPKDLDSQRRVYSLRSVHSKDSNFLFKLYSTTRNDVHAMGAWTIGQKNRFLKIQFEAQHNHYQTHFANAIDNIILDRKSNRVGRLIVHQTSEELRLVDISIMPDSQRSGIGSSILNDTIEKARAAALPLRLHVAKDNPALNWYLKSGFRETGASDFNYQLEWSPVSIFTHNLRPSTAPKRGEY